MRKKSENDNCLMKRNKYKMSKNQDYLIKK